MDIIFTIIISYFLGSISFSFLIGKYWGKIDIREHGSGNAGATNTLRVLGALPGIIVFILDGLKGVLSVLLAYLISANEPIVMILGGIFAIIGHNWPIYLNFKGGKGVATTIGVVASLLFLPFILSAVIACIILIITRYVSLASIIFALFIPIFVIIMDYEIIYQLFSLLLAVLVCIRHKDNIKRLLKGTERKLGKEYKVR
jgi:glycerol-3-phosphate acyltransferase PlsY